jgi:hypothetical protein
LTSEGLIAFNITNRNLDLAPILNAAATLSGYQAVLIENPIDRPGSTDFLSSARTEVRWLLFVPKGLEIPAWPGMQSNGFANARAWTDSHASLLQAFRY